MTQYYGDFVEDDTIYLMFNTFTSDDPSASCTITNFTNTDVHIHKDGGVVQRNNAAGITVDTDFDSITGSHLITIDTSDNTVAGFWVTGSDYFVRIEGTTVDGAIINAVVGHFSIQNRYTRGTDSASTHTASDVWSIGTRALTDKSNFGLSTTSINLIWDDLTANMTAIGSVGKLLADNINATISSRSPSSEYDTEMARLDVDVSSRNAIAPNTVIPDAAGVAPTAVEIRTEMEGVGTKLTDVLTDTSELQTNQGNWLTATGFNTVVPDAAGTAPTAAEIKTEIEAAGSSLAQILADTGTDGVVVADKTGFSLSDAGVDAILDENIEGTHTLREMIRLFASMLVGKVSGGGTATITFRDIDDTKNRIVMTVTDVGDRTNVVLTES